MFTSVALSSEKNCEVDKIRSFFMNLPVRLAVIVLVLTGVFASSKTEAASVSAITFARNSALPTPMCAPDDPNACGMARGRK
jgi:hypothetical protein